MSLTVDDIKAEVQRLGPWFHSIEVAPGVRTKTAPVANEPVDHPRSTWEHVRRELPHDLTGMRVLDVGCNAGFYSIEAKRRHAAYVLGVDAQRREIRQAKFVAKALDLDIDFRRMSVYDLNPAAIGTFDVTLALGLVYHLKHLILGLERLFSVTRGLLILETEALTADQASTLNTALGGLDSRLHALAYVENDPDALEAVYNWFVPSKSALSAMLRNIGFVDVRVASEAGGRVVFTCRRPTAIRELPVNHLRSSLRLTSVPTNVRPGEAMTFTLLAQNTGVVDWTTSVEGDSERGWVRLGAHLFLENGDEVAWDYGRGDFHAAVAPGAAAPVAITLQAPQQPGTYIVEFDVVAEQLTWFEDCGSPVLAHPLIVVDDEAS